MGINAEQMIKKAVSECIAEEMLRELGLFVMRIGQENTVNPITQLEWFIKKCGGTFKLDRKPSDIYTELTYLQKLPDFCIVNKKGEVYFVEVKFRSKGMLDPEQVRVLTLYPQTNILVVNIEVGDSLAYIPTGSESTYIANDKVTDELKETRFHIMKREEINQNDLNSVQSITIPFFNWMCDVLEIENEAEAERVSKIIQNYELLVEQWLK